VALSEIAAKFALESYGIVQLAQIRLHIGNPGAEGKNNIAAENTKKAFTFAPIVAFSRKSSGAIEWVEVKGKEKYSFFTLWQSAGEGGAFMGFGEFSEPISVEIGDTFKIPSGLLVASIE
jgi:hypothetical protein